MTSFAGDINVSESFSLKHTYYLLSMAAWDITSLCLQGQVSKIRNKNWQETWQEM